MQNPSFEDDEVILDDPEWLSWATWNPAEGAGSNAQIDDTEAVDGKLRECVRRQLVSDVPLGAFLSGGVDSSLVTAAMDGAHTFSIGFEDESYNELPYARMVADRYAMEAHERVVEADLVHNLPSMIHHLDEPADPFAVGVFLVSQEAAREVKVVLTGDGGDENFAGYDRFAGQRLAELYGVLPAWFRRQVMRRLIDCVPATYTYKSFAEKARMSSPSTCTGRARASAPPGSLRDARRCSASGTP